MCSTLPKSPVEKTQKSEKGTKELVIGNNYLIVTNYITKLVAYNFVSYFFGGCRRHLPILLCAGHLPLGVSRNWGWWEVQ